ncbi:nucleoside-diphosphate sugar epimerase/dehydratase [Kocuria rosea]|uniref:nucleoside-diphosphate sugar epimerase/dehydratase n=1 Tax=Kocuria rosea TaxID=1275 RepID=UPI00203B92CF|nr:hypothetical protein [Kocuria rosea]MCM3687823.1 hypothetical protein [Kocuria rosea]
MLKRNIWISPAAWREDHIARLRRADAAALAAALLLTQLLRFGTDHGRLALGGLTVTYWLVGAVLGVAWWTWLELRGARDVRLTGHGIEEHRQVLSATLVLFAAMVISFYVLGLPMERGYIVLALLLGTTLLLVGRSAAAHGLTRHRLAGAAMTRTLVVGREPGVVELVQQLQRHPASGFDPVAVYAPTGARILPRSLAAVQMPPNTLADGHEPSVEGIVTACRRYRIEALVLAASTPLSAEGIRRLSWRLADERIRLVLAPELTDVAGPRIHIQHLAGLPLVHVSTPRMSRWRMLLK